MSLSSPLPYASQPGIVEAGCDEAGRGCLAGPVFAAAVVLPPDYSHPWLNDSKQLSEKRREQLRGVIEADAVAWAVAEVSPAEIDKINILNASILAMHRALDSVAEILKQKSIALDKVAVDGNRFKPWRDTPWHTIVKGDGKLANIAAASILAKTYRDERMRLLDEQFPVYHWRINKGYPTKAHREAIRLHGTTEHHRLSFRLLDTQLTLDL